VLAAPTYADARAVARDLLGGRSVSAQTYGLRRVVLALDDALRRPLPGLEDVAGSVVEVHPELSFMAMAGRPPRDPLPSKRTPLGRRLREEALARWLRGAGPGAIGAPDGDDHLDALAAAWSAHRWATGTAEVLGGEPDETGLPMRMVI
jgi:predicted RNase H-like nuclease